MSELNTIVRVLSLDYEGRGVSKVAGKTVFIDGALPFETVSYRVLESKKQFDEGVVVSVLSESSQRVDPECGYFETCGGCKLQHVSVAAQVALKQRVLEEQLWRIGKVAPEQILPAVYGTAWHYRDRARLSVSYDSEGSLKLGFKAKRTNDVVAIDSCKILPREISDKLPHIKKLLIKMLETDVRVKFIEVFRSEGVFALNIFFFKRPSERKQDFLKAWFDKIFADAACCWQLWMQYGRAESTLVYPEKSERARLGYRLPDFDIFTPYRPGDFTQINSDMNRVMVARALKLLDIHSGERIADLFCGLGNFSLPMAKYGAEVLAIEGSSSLTSRAKQNAVENKCAQYVTFINADLFRVDAKAVESWGIFDKMLLDPPRSGAYAVVKSLHAPYLPKRIVYVSCNPSTLARDAGVLVKKGYTFKSVGVMNMFPHTAHVESIGIFDLKLPPA